MNATGNESVPGSLNLTGCGNLPLFEQVAAAIKELIVVGELAPGMRIPSVRSLARDSRVSVPTIRRAIDFLINEGWLVSKHGAGTYVAEAVSAGKLWFGSGADLDSSPETQTDDDKSQALEIDFRPDAAISDLFDDLAWEDAIVKAAKESTISAGEIEDPRGMPELRQEIARWLNTQRGMSVTDESVLIVNGAQQARDIITRVLVRNGTRVAVEDPGSTLVRKMLQIRGAEIVPVSVDDSGIVCDELDRVGETSLLYLTPSAQFPTNAMLSYGRRKWLAAWADKRETIIIEDDDYSDLVYDCRPAPAIAALNPNRTIYFGSLTQFMLSSWRLGYLVVPPQFGQTMTRLKWQTDRSTSPLLQELVYRLFRSGNFHRHIARVKRFCTVKRNVLLSHLDLLSAAGCRFTPVKCGVNQTIWLPSSLNDVEIAVKCREAGVGLLPVSPFYLNGPSSPGLLLNFTAATPQQIEQGTWRIRKVLGGQYGS